MTRALVIPVDADPYEVQLSTPPRLEEIKSLLGGGWLEGTLAATGDTMYVDEEGKLKGLPVNAAATSLLKFHNDVIVGPAVLLGPPDGQGNDTDNLTHAKVL